MGLHLECWAVRPERRSIRAAGDRAQGLELPVWLARVGQRLHQGSGQAAITLSELARLVAFLGWAPGWRAPIDHFARRQPGLPSYAMKRAAEALARP